MHMLTENLKLTLKLPKNYTTGQFYADAEHSGRGCCNLAAPEECGLFYFSYKLGGRNPELLLEAGGKIGRRGKPYQV